MLYCFFKSTKLLFKLLDEKSQLHFEEHKNTYMFSALVFRFCSVSDFKGKGEMTDGVFYFVRVYLFVFVFFCVYVQASVGMVRHEQDLCFSEGQHEMAFATHVTFEIWYFSKWNRKLVKNGVLCAKMGPGMNVSIWLYLNGNASVSDLLLNICNICNFYYTTIQKFGVFMILKQQISISEWFLKNHVTLKTGVTAAENSALPSQE